jgi:hypothetical protein
MYRKVEKKCYKQEKQPVAYIIIFSIQFINLG